MDRFETYLYKLSGDKNARNGFLQSMGPFAQMPEKVILANIKSCCDQAPAAEKRRYLNSLQSLSQNKTFQSKKAQQRIRHLTNIFNTNQANQRFLGYASRPGLGYGRQLGIAPGLGYAPGYGYGYGNRGFFGRGLLGSLVLLFLLGAIL